MTTTYIASYGDEPKEQLCRRLLLHVRCTLPNKIIIISVSLYRLTGRSSLGYQWETNNTHTHNKSQQSHVLGRGDFRIWRLPFVQHTAINKLLTHYLLIRCDICIDYLNLFFSTFLLKSVYPINCPRQTVNVVY